VPEVQGNGQGEAAEMNTFRRMCEELCELAHIKCTVGFMSPATNDVTVIIYTDTWPRVLKVDAHEAVWSCRDYQHVCKLLVSVNP
jgi:D-aminopeptidase